MNGYQEKLREAFLSLMEKGWVDSPPKATIPDLPGMRTILSTGESYLRMVDGYYTSTNSDLSSGMTTIFDDEIPVWVMHYGGRYPKIAIPFLKSCLMQAYVRERRFYGGRGPHFIREERFTYINTIRRDSFLDFEGEEQIFDLDNRRLGYHWYRGMSLV